MLCCLQLGEGQRLRPLTKFWPKSLMPVHGIPLMEYWLSDLIRCGIDPIYVNTCYLAEIVEEYLARDHSTKEFTSSGNKNYLVQGELF